MATPSVTTISRNNRRIIVEVTFVSAGSDDQTNFVVYDSSVQNAALKDQQGNAVVDTKTCHLNKVIYSNNSAAAKMKLNFDATTPVLAVAIPFNRSDELDFNKEGGLTNTGGTGITGDITLTTSGIASGEALHILLDVTPY